MKILPRAQAFRRSEVTWSLGPVGCARHVQRLSWTSDRDLHHLRGRRSYMVPKHPRLPSIMPKHFSLFPLDNQLTRFGLPPSFAVVRVTAREVFTWQMKRSREQNIPRQTVEHHGCVALLPPTPKCRIWKWHAQFEPP